MVGRLFNIKIKAIKTVLPVYNGHHKETLNSGLIDKVYSGMRLLCLCS